MPVSEAAARVLESGYLLEAKALDLINALPGDVDIQEFVGRLMERKGVGSKVITTEDVEALIPEPAQRPTIVHHDMLEAGEVEVLSDPTQSLAPAEGAEGFSRLFLDRYSRLRSIVGGRLDLKGAVNVSTARGVAPGKKVKVAGLLSDKSSRRGTVELRVDDPGGTLKVVCSDPLVERAAMEAPLDSMVVVEVSRGKGSGQFFANSVSLPDVPGRKPATSSHRVYAVLLSDLHVGSRMFLGDDFSRFLGWLKGGYGDEDLVNRIRYIVIAGDLVDGVGVYPGQEYQLAERDPKKQYEIAASLLKQVPANIQIVISPGNHDTVRQALPQPAVSVDLAETLYSMENVRMVGDPSYVKLHGTNFLIYHGKSLDDIIAMTPGLEYNRPTDAMKLLLRARHLAPTYGKRTALSPESRDFLVIDEVPDVMHVGHVHTYGELAYRGTLLLNSGTWQAQTSFQSNMGLEPTPSVVPVVDLSEMKVIRRSFSAAGFVA
jgi:DNA polymerase II small subunit